MTAHAPAAGMAPSPPQSRRYVLRLAEEQSGVRARVERHGPDNPLAVGVGRPAGQAPVIAGLLFAACPHAHGVAALRALEQAAETTLPPGQAAAREAIVLAEALAASLWRFALSWPALPPLDGSSTAQAPDPASVKAARDAAQNLTHALFPAGWTRIGGAPLGHDLHGARIAARDLTQVVETALASRNALPVHADAIRLAPLRSPPVLDDLDTAFHSAAADPMETAREETPRALSALRALRAAALPDSQATPTSLAPWFAAQQAHTNALARALHTCLGTLVPDAPVSSQPAASGQGVGIAMTARGRLRHAISLKAGKITDWRATAPTDWNFAPGGPVERTAQRLVPGARLHKEGQWLVAAFDPCAVCHVELEAGHA